MEDITSREAKALGHFRKRLQERYGISNIRHDEWMDLRSQITNGHKNRFVGRKSGYKTWWLIDVRGQKVLALYCSKTRGFLSCLPIGMIRSALQGKPSKMRYIGLCESSIMIQRKQQICDILNISG